ncbi:mismatch repair endonuclease PMS2 [Hetaerina americana]|uniref:mismatch repair endonuclease PMS2 n=1 Tax=Hetaerina americana TaxID=62018 RepID=UPI003A7F5095
MGKIGVENALQSNTAKVSGITPISQDVVHKICSGQVVLTLAVAVKELLENSLDAGATTIDVRLIEQGSTLVEVADNGSGIKEEDFKGIALKHHTSKISNFTDLESVSTFGFRGEALSSLCSLCGGLTISTCHQSSACASSLEFDASGTLIMKKPCARQIGTTVSLKSLFSGLPVRRREFLRHLQREFTKMTHLLYAYCLVSTRVRITCTNQKQSKGSHSSTIVATQGGESITDNIGCVFGHKQLMALIDFKQKEVTEEIMEEFGIKTRDTLNESGVEECEGLEKIKVESSPFTITGCLSSCEHGKGRGAPDRQFFFINSRPCEPTKVIRLINEVYHQYNSHQYPFVFIDVKVNGMDGNGVDVNVTPDKRQIFIENEKLLLATIKTSLLEMYKSTPSTFKLQNLPNSFSMNAALNSATEVTATSSTPPHSKALTITKALSRFAQSNSSVMDKNSAPGTSKRHGANFGSPKIKQPRLDSFVVSKSAGSQVPKVNDAQYADVIQEPESVCTDLSGNPPKNKEFDKFQSKETHPLAIDIEAVDVNTVTDSLKHCDSGDKFNSEISVTDIKAPERNSEMKDSTSGDISIESDHSECAPSKGKESKMTIETQIREPVAGNAKEALCDVRRFSFKAEDRSIDIYERHASAKKMKVREYEVDLPIENSRKQCSEMESDSSIEVVILDEDAVAENRDLRSVRMNVSLIDISKNFEREEERKLKCIKQESKKKLRFSAAINPKDNSMAETELQREITKDMFSKMKVIGQFNLGFLITKLGSDLFIIDQHASDEKYNFETLQITTNLQQQPLVVPQPLDLTVAAKSVLTENIEVFERNGFRFSFPPESKEEVSDCKAYLTSIPFSRNWTFGKEDVDELIFMLQDSPHANCRPSRVRDMFASRACRKSVMIGDALSIADMHRIITHMGEMDQPWNCPHGRPTMRHLVNLDLIASDIR